MQAVDRRRVWNPTGMLAASSKVEVSKVSKVTFDTFETAIPAQSQNFFGSAAMPADEPDAWRPEYEKWIRTACIFHDRCSSSIASLHLSFAAWCNAGVTVCPCTLETFARLLVEDGFEVRAGMVEGLVLVEDCRTAWQSPTV